MKIEVGKKYRRRDGEIVEIVRFDAEHTYGHTHPYWSDQSGSYRVDGVYSCVEGFDDDDLDLIEEVVDTMAAGAEAIGKQMRGEYTTYGEVGQVEQMRDSINATREPAFDPHQELHRVLGPGGVIHYRTPTDREKAEEAQAGYLRSLVPADIATITAIEQSMRNLTASETNAVVAWFCTRYPASPF